MASYTLGYRFYISLVFHLRVLAETFENILHALHIWRRRRVTLPERLDGRTLVITGANTGIGKITAQEFARLGAQVIMGCRDQEKGRKAVEEIVASMPLAMRSNVTLLELDLSSLGSVRKFATKVCSLVDSIDYLINNAGVMMCPEWETADGYEYQLGTNHLGHFLLTHLLLDKIRKAPTARIINLSSVAHMQGEIHFDDVNLRGGRYTPLRAYTQSKLANLLFSHELARKLEASSVRVYAVHPGLVATDLWQHTNFVGKFLLEMVNRLIMITPEQGAQTTLYCAFEPELVQESGKYYQNCRKVERMLPHAIDDEVAAKLWTLSHTLCLTDESTHL